MLAVKHKTQRGLHLQGLEVAIKHTKQGFFNSSSGGSALFDNRMPHKKSDLVKGGEAISFIFLRKAELPSK